MLIREGVLKIRVRDCSCDISSRHIHIEITSKHNGLVWLVPLCIPNSFLHLGHPEPVVTFALEMQVVGNDRPSANTGVSDKGEPAADPFLEWFYLWEKPTWLPEVGLLMKAHDTCIRQPPTGKRRLTMIRGRMACALGQFPELAPKYIIELQSLCDFPRDMDVVSAPSVQVRLLQQQDVCLAATQKLDDPRQL